MTEESVKYAVEEFEDPFIKTKWDNFDDYCDSHQINAATWLMGAYLFVEATKQQTSSSLVCLDLRNFLELSKRFLRMSRIHLKTNKSSLKTAIALAPKNLQILESSGFFKVEKVLSPKKFLIRIL